MAPPASLRVFCDPTLAAPALAAPDFLTALEATGLGVRAITMRGGFLRVATASHGRSTAWNPDLDPAWADMPPGLFGGMVATSFVNVVIYPCEPGPTEVPPFEAYATVNHPNVAIVSLPEPSLPAEVALRLLGPLRLYDLVVCPTPSQAAVMQTLVQRDGVDVQYHNPRMGAGVRKLADTLAPMLSPEFVPRYNPTAH